MLKGKLALVTGAGSGIGRATCELFALENSKVVVTDYSLEKAKHTVNHLCGDDHVGMEMDVSNSTNVSNVLNAVVKRYSTPPNILVNCAGITKDNFLLNLPVEDFQDVLNVNLKGTFLVTQKVCQLLINQNLPGSIINVSSIIARRGNRGQCAYASSKAGVEAFSKCVALEMSRHNIRCNNVLPGFVTTPMTQTVPDKVKDIFRKAIPMNRFGNTSEVAEAILFLASDKASYINGTSLVISGGFE